MEKRIVTVSSGVVDILAVGTGVVVIVVAVAVVLVVLLVTVSMRGRQNRAAERREEGRREVNEANERARRAEQDRDLADQHGDPTTDPDQ
jgi:hypothetical protein